MKCTLYGVKLFAEKSKVFAGEPLANVLVSINCNSPKSGAPKKPNLAAPNGIYTPN